MKLLVLLCACGPATPFSLDLPRHDAGSVKRWGSPRPPAICSESCGIYWADGSWRCSEVCE